MRIDFICVKSSVAGCEWAIDWFSFWQICIDFSTSRCLCTANWLQCGCYAAKCICELCLYSARHMGLIVVFVIVFDVHYAISWTHFTYTQAHSHALNLCTSCTYTNATNRCVSNSASAFHAEWQNIPPAAVAFIIPQILNHFFCFPRLHRICVCIACWSVCKTREHVCSCSRSENKNKRKTRLAREERFRVHARMKRN